MKTPSPAPPFPSSSTLITIPPSHYLLNKLRKLSMLRASPPSRDNGGGGDFLQRAERLGLEGGGGGAGLTVHPPPGSRGPGPLSRAHGCEDLPPNHPQLPGGGESRGCEHRESRRQ